MKCCQNIHNTPWLMHQKNTKQILFIVIICLPWQLLILSIACLYLSFVTALDPFFRPLNTITSAILNTNWFGCRLYLGIFILFYSTNYTIQLYYLRIIYLARVLFLLPFAICASCKFGGKREKRCQRKCQNRRREDRREVRGKGEQKMIAIFWRQK